MRILLAVLVAFSLAACESGPSTNNDDPTAESTPAENDQTGESTSDESASFSTNDEATDDSEETAASACFDACMEQNQMRSVPMEQVEDDCRAQCDEGGELDESPQ
jgi:hypothetical protein